MPRPNLRQGLDRDVYAVLAKIEESSGSGPFKSIGQAYDAIKRSNSHLSRQKKRPLEDSIDRVLQFRKEEQQDSDSEAAIEEAEARLLPKNPEDERFVLNRQLTKHWHTKPADTKSTDTMTNQDDQRPKKKRRVQEDGDDKQSGSEKTKANGAKEDAGDKEKTAPKKTPRPARFSVDNPPESFPLGGVAPLQDDLESTLQAALFKSYGQVEEYRPQGVLLTGPDGVGKRSLVRSVAARMKLPVISIRDCFQDPERIEKNLVEAFDEAVRLAPCIMLAEKMEKYMSKQGSSTHNEHHEKVLESFLRQRERMYRELPDDSHVVIVGTSVMPTDLHLELCLGDIFCITIQLRVPISEAREEILKVLTRESEKFELDESELHELAKMTHGFVALDLHNVIRLAFLLHYKKNNSHGPIATMDDMKGALKDYIPSLRKEGFTEVPKVTWDNIGAMEEARKQLDQSIVGPIKHPQMYEAWSLGKSAGVILWGPPGCGKTLIAQAVANEAQASFILVSGPELLNKYVGESERAVRELFQRARSSTPCVLFFDEMDSLVPKRDGASSDSGVRVVNALLTEMDGVQDSTGIYIIGTTNRPDMIDDAMLRPGRLSTKIFVDLPTEDERVAILQTIFRNRQPKASTVAAGRVESVARDGRCSGFSGADLSGLYYAAANNGLERWRADPSTPLEIIGDDWGKALEKARPSVRNPGEYADIRKRLETGD